VRPLGELEGGALADLPRFTPEGAEVNGPIVIV